MVTKHWSYIELQSFHLQECLTEGNVKSKVSCTHCHTTYFLCSCLYVMLEIKDLWVESEGSKKVMKITYEVAFICKIQVVGKWIVGDTETCNHVNRVMIKNHLALCLFEAYTVIFTYRISGQINPVCIFARLQEQIEVQCRSDYADVHLWWQLNEVKENIVNLMSLTVLFPFYSWSSEKLI